MAFFMITDFSVKSSIIYSAVYFFLFLCDSPSFPLTPKLYIFLSLRFLSISLYNDVIWFSEEEEESEGEEGVENEEDAEVAGLQLGKFTGFSFTWSVLREALKKVL